MRAEQKMQVRDAFMRIVSRVSAHSLNIPGVDNLDTEIIQTIGSGDWEHVEDDQWMSLARQVGFYCGEWQAVDTDFDMLLRILMNDARRTGSAYLVTAGEGTGKSFSARRYARHDGAVFYVQASPEMNRSSFLKALTRAAGLPVDGPVPAQVALLTSNLECCNEPLIVIDDAHKLKERVLFFLCQVCRHFSGIAGVVVLGRRALKERIVEHARMDRPGYRDFYQKHRSRFVSFVRASKKDMSAVCTANGVTDEEAVATIVLKSDGDLHQVVEMIGERNRLEIAA